MEIRINPLTVTHCTSIARPIENCYNLIYLSHAYRKNRLQRSKSDNKTFLLIRLKKYLNPHENSCSKVISILTTGNILHESSSAPRQHKSVQYKLLTLYLHRDVSHTDMLQLHFISCRGVSGAGGNMRGSRDFCQSYLVPSLFYSLQRGANGFIAEKTILILYQGSRWGPLFPRGVSNFSRGRMVQMLISLETHVPSCYFPGGVRTPYPPLDPHMGNVIITGQYLSQSRFYP